MSLATESRDTGLLFGVAENIQRNRSDVAIPVVASLFVLVFTLVRGAKDSMWFDEAFSFAVAKGSLGSLVDFVLTGEPNMGPYYITLWGWIRINDGDLWIRLLSALFTVAALWAVWVVVAALADGTAAVSQASGVSATLRSPAASGQRKSRRDRGRRIQTLVGNHTAAGKPRHPGSRTRRVTGRNGDDAANPAPKPDRSRASPWVSSGRNLL